VALPIVSARLCTHVAACVSDAEKGAHVMKRKLIETLVVVMVAGLACSSTHFKSTWKDPTVQRLDFQGKRVAAFVVTKDESLRRSAEDALARELQARGVQATAGYQLIPDETTKDKDALRSQLTNEGIQGAVVMRVVDRRQEVSYEPPPGPYYGSLYGYWDYGWATTAAPGYLRTDTIVSVETLVYQVPTDRLLWGGVSETTDPKKLESFIKEIVDQAAKEMKKAGLIAGK
jgi:hypothetical protein